MIVERLFENYSEPNGVQKNDVLRKASEWWHNNQYQVEPLKHADKTRLLSAIQNNTDFTGDMLNPQYVTVLLLIPKPSCSPCISEPVEGECLLAYRTVRPNAQNVVSHQKVGVIPLHRSQANHEDKWEKYQNKNFDLYTIEVYQVHFREPILQEQIANACRTFFHVTPTEEDQKVTLNEVDMWQQTFPQHMIHARNALIKQDLLAERNLNAQQVIILLFIARSKRVRCGTTKEHAAMLYRGQIRTTEEDLVEKTIYVSLYPGQDPVFSHSLECTTPFFHNFRQDLENLFEGGATNLHSLEAYRITFEGAEAVQKIHQAYKEILNKDPNTTQFERWSIRDSGLSAYLPSRPVAADAESFFLCYWGAGCAWLACCFSKPSNNCVSLIVNLLGKAELYTSASARAQVMAGMGHLLMILSAGVLFSEFARLIGIEYPVEQADETIKYCLGFIAAGLLVSLSTYALDAEKIQACLPTVFCNSLSVQSAGALPAKIYLGSAVICAIISAVIFIMRGMEHGFSHQTDHLEHAPLVWGMFAIGMAITFGLYFLLSCCSSENLGCSRPITLHRDLRRMEHFSSRRTIGLFLRADQDYQPPHGAARRPSDVPSLGEGGVILTATKSALYAAGQEGSQTDQQLPEFQV